MREPKGAPAFQQKKILDQGNLSFQIPVCVGKNIRSLRKARRMTQKDLASAIGCEASYISHIERVSRSVSIRHLFQIADAMETSPASLVSDKSDQIKECLEWLEKLNEESFLKAKEFIKELAEKRTQSV